jgi:hypothetical protein
MKSHFQILAIGFILALMQGCASTSYYKEAGKSEPYADLMFAKMKSGVGGMLGGTNVSPVEINGLPPNQWNKWGFSHFKIHPGETTLLLKANLGGSVTGLAHVNFYAEQGETYTVDMKNEIEKVLFIVTDNNGKLMTQEKAIKQLDRSAPTYVPIYMPAN